VTVSVELTPRQQEMLEGIADGLTRAQIGERLHIAESTVKLHSTWLFAKLGARNGCQAVAAGFRAGLLK
jgi:DNA-binding NarL/FixJ family response regulator